jgi:hypothetical protein
MIGHFLILLWYDEKLLLRGMKREVPRVLLSLFLPFAGDLCNQGDIFVK